MKICSVEGCERRIKAKGYCPKHYIKFQRCGDPNGKGTPFGEPKKFMLESIKTESDECNTWPYGTKAGYGYLWWNGRMEIVPRIVCEIFNGPPTEEAPIVRHLCGKGHLGCFNPKHLEWSTMKENSADTLIHGTRNRGERHGMSKLKKEDVIEIYRLAWEGQKSQKEIASLYGIKFHKVSSIKTGNSWSWLTGHKKKEGGD